MAQDAEAWTTEEIFATLAGTFASICFTLQFADCGALILLIALISLIIRYLPQAWLNYQRQSVKGFNTTGIIIKLLGACFLTVNAYLTGGSFAARTQVSFPAS